MILIFLHGLPATGKYTVGRQLASLSGSELYHNHQVVDEVLRHHPFGSAEFVALRDKMWREHLGRAASEKRGDMVFTFNPENSVPPAFIAWLFDDLPKSGVRLLSVELVAAETEIEARLGSSQRQGFRKLTDLQFYRQLRDAGTFRQPAIPRTDLRVDTGKMLPEVAARLIADHFGLRSR